MITASGNKVEPYWPMLFCKALKSANIEDMLTSVASAAPAGGAGPVAAAGGAAAAEEAPKEEVKEEAEDVDMGGLFGDEEDDY